MNPGTAAALVLLAGAVAWLLSGPDEALRRVRWIAGAGGVAVVGAALRPARRAGPAPLCGGPVLRERWAGLVAGWRRRLAALPVDVTRAALCVAGGVVAGLLLRSPVPAVAGVLLVPVTLRWLRRRAREREAARRRLAVIDLCAGLAGELRTGRPPHQALAEEITRNRWLTGPGIPQAAVGVLAAARYGGDVPVALRRAARVPGAEGLAGVAACWQVAVDRGAGLADGLDRVVGALRAQEQQRDDTQAQLAGPRSTAKLLAVLPLLGVVLGTALGTAPLSVLLHTPVGLGCLAVAAALEWAGLAWTARIVRGVVP